MDAAGVVEHEIQRQRVKMVVLFEKALVRRVKRRMDMRIVRFWRSTNDVEMRRNR
jgi:hypothetical protein